MNMWMFRDGTEPLWGRIWIGSLRQQPRPVWEDALYHGPGERLSEAQAF